MIKSTLLYVAATAIGITSTMPAAHADWHSTVGSALSPLSQGLANGCFLQVGGVLSNAYCSDRAQAEAIWPVILGSAGNKTLNIPTNGRSVLCSLVVANEDGTIYGTYTLKTDPQGSSYQLLTTKFSVPEGGIAQVTCWIGKDNKVTGIYSGS